MDRLIRALDRFELQRLATPRKWSRHKAVLAILLALVITWLVLLAYGADVLKSSIVFVEQVLFSKRGWTETLVLLVPLGLAGLGVTVAKKAGFWNIGGEGQLLAGATIGVVLAGPLSKSSVPWVLVSPALVIATFIGGATLCLAAAVAKVLRGTDEVLTTLLSNFIVIYAVSYLVSGPLQDPETMWIQSATLAEEVRFDRFPGLGRVNGSIFILAATAAVILYLERRTDWNTLFEVSASNPDALESSGRRSWMVTILAAVLSGGLCGLAGWAEVAGTQYRLIEDLSPGYGYYAVVIAVLSGGSCSRALWLATVLAVLQNGIDTSTRFAGLPVYIGEVVLGTTLICYVLLDVLSRHCVHIRR